MRLNQQKLRELNMRLPDLASLDYINNYGIFLDLIQYIESHINPMFIKIG